MKKKNGFTLIEMTAVVLILSLLTILAVPTIEKKISNTKNKVCNTVITSIESAASNYTYLYTGIVDNEITNKGYFEIELFDLQREGLLKVDIKNPYTNEIISNTNKVKITKEGNVYSYTYMGDDCK